MDKVLDSWEYTRENMKESVEATDKILLAFKSKVYDLEKRVNTITQTIAPMNSMLREHEIQIKTLTKNEKSDKSGDKADKNFTSSIEKLTDAYARLLQQTQNLKEEIENLKQRDYQHDDLNGNRGNHYSRRHHDPPHDPDDDPNDGWGEDYWRRDLDDSGSENSRE
jgi:chromosome segregation ATPase